MVGPEESREKRAPDGVPIGHLVYTQDGKELGRVKEVRPGHFKLDVSMAEDYWLRLSEVRLITPERVIVGFDRADLPRHRLERPEFE
jgi:hypothetical protein